MWPAFRSARTWSSPRTPPSSAATGPEAVDEPSRARLRSLGLDLVEVSVDEAARLALNLVSDGTTVTMTRGRPGLVGALRERGLWVFELDTTELAKGGGGIRCTALTLDNPTRGRSTCPL